MRLFLNSVGVALLVIVLVLFIVAVWTADGRYGVTGFILMFPSGAALMVAAFATHKERCSGC